jgi:hypothetical protein
MNTGQTMLTTMAMVLLGTTVFSVNRNNLQHGSILRQTELGIYAVSLATSIVQRASGMSFDELTVGNSSVPTTIDPTTGVLTISTKLGRDIGGDNKVGPTEIIRKDTSFDDFDDYNNFDKDTTIVGVDIFHISAIVYYVSQTPPYSRTTAPTWLKQMDIATNNSISRKVFEDTSKSLSKAGVDTIKMSHIFSYY